MGTETEEASETVVAGAVISQSVKAKSEAKAGSSIGITVSKGSDKPAKRVSVPSLIGMTQTQAEDVLASLKLVSKAEDPVYSENDIQAVGGRGHGGRRGFDRQLHRGVGQGLRHRAPRDRIG